MIPLIILAVEDESSRDFMIRLYESSVARMHLEAAKYLSVREDIEDVVADTVVKLVEKVDLLQTIEAGKRLPYTMTTVRHMAFRFLRRKNLLQMTSFDTLEDVLTAPAEDADDRILKEQRNARLRELLGALPTEDLLLLEEKYILLWSDAEIAETLTAQGFRWDEWA
ncbi:MAG: sigma-70 family RNA polymerase sigma factor [Oscillospiraceae bacterium]|nr:sigma-70 family RNA polymerase sigma factor [Oscillospiraceae bacterium]